MKVIMAPVANRPECKVALDQAFQLANALSANVIGCHLRPHRIEDRSAKHSDSVFGFRKWNAISQGANEDEIELSSDAAAALFSNQLAANNFKRVKHAVLGATRSAQWVEMVGSLEKLFSIIGPTSDVSVVSRPKSTSKGPGNDFMLAALLRSGKPVIVLPQNPIPSMGKRILIAWNQSIEAARAVSAALPLLQMAESVCIVNVGAESRAGPKATAVANYLKYWGVKTSRTSTKGRDPAEEILSVYRKEESDLIVMGAYSRSRFRELVFGGVTEDLLFRAPQPIFALHS